MPSLVSKALRKLGVAGLTKEIADEIGEKLASKVPTGSRRSISEDCREKCATVNEACELLSVSRTTVFSLIRSGQLVSPRMPNGREVTHVNGLRVVSRQSLNQVVAEYSLSARK